jgi:hypothetical protein
MHEQSQLGVFGPQALPLLLFVLCNVRRCWNLVCT